MCVVLAGPRRAAELGRAVFPVCLQEKLTLQQQLRDTREQLVQQAEYCTQMGAAACTLLWGVSSSEDVVKAILGGVSERCPWALEQEFHSSGRKGGEKWARGL